MKIMKELIYMAPLTLLLAGCNMPARPDTTISEWEREGQLPRLAPTGRGEERVYSERIYSEAATYPLDDQPQIVVESDQRQNRAGDLQLAQAIRRHIEFDEGLAPSLQNVTIRVKNDAVILQGTVKSDLDSRVIVDDLRDVDGVTLVKNDLAVTRTAY